MEGLPTVITGIIAFFYLCDQPASARWLSNTEKDVVAADIKADRMNSPAKADKSFRGAVRDPKVLLMAVIYFAYFCSLNTVLLWSPTVMKQVGVKTVGTIGWLSGGISVIATIGMIMIGHSSDRHMERRWHVAMCGLIAASCFLLLPLAANNISFTVLLLAIATTGIFAILGLFWTIPSAYLEQGRAAAGGIALISAIGSFGGAVSPSLIGWIKVHTGSLYFGLSTIAALLIVGMGMLLLWVPAIKTNSAHATGQH